MNLDEAWTFILEVISQVIIPAWNDLIQYIPLLLLLLLVAAVAGLARYWQRNAALNRPRVRRPIPSGRMPEGMHLPGPSVWPFVAPIGLLLIVFAVALGIGSPVSLALLALGAAIGVIGIAGWFWDAGREYRALEAGRHLQAGSARAELPPVAAARTPDWALQPPEGTHLPGPSAWPFLAPVGLFFIVAGFIFGPALLIGGLLMAAIAAIGWLLDADRELEDVETHGHPSQGDRDPARAWPSRLIPLYVIVAGIAILVTLAPWLLSLLPGSG